MKENTWINEKTIFVFTSIVSFIAIIISFKSGNMLAYNDATAHLNTARRIIDSLTPGLVQIGSVWLPLLHLLLVPFVSIDILWQTGLAGAIVSGASFVISAIFLFKLVFLITENRWIGLISVLVFSLNLNLLYLQTTTMFEPLLMAVAFGAVYFLSKWTQNKNINYLVIGAFFIMLATLTRYDGWALFIASIFYIGVVGFFLKRKGIGGTLILFTMLAGFGIFLWLLYNQLIFGDALYFSNGEYSAAAQQQVLFDRGSLPTKHDLLLSLKTYSLASFLNLGIFVSITSLIGLIFYLKDNLLKINNWGPFILLVPFFFNVISLYLGQSVIWMPMIQPFLYTYFNARYGLLMLPAAAFFAGYLGYKYRALRYVVIFVVALQVFAFINPTVFSLFHQKTGIITLQDTVSSVNEQTLRATEFIHNNYDDGLILVSTASADAFVFRANLPLKNFITEGTGNYWKESLQDPTRYAKWIVYFNDKSDRVGKVIGEWPYLDEFYVKLYQDQTYEIWKKKD